MPNWSRAVTVTLKELPAVALAGALTVKCVAAAAVTLILVLVPVIEPATVSVAVSVCVPTVTISSPRGWSSVRSACHPGRSKRQPHHDAHAINSTF